MSNPLTVLPFVLLAGAVQAQDLHALDGIWTSVTVSVGTQMTATYSPTMGVTLVPAPQVQVQPSPFGPLMLDDGTYAMPDVGYSGRVKLAPDGSLTFDGPLSQVRAALSPDGSELILSFPGGTGAQVLTYRRG